MNEDKTEKSSTDEQPFIAKPIADKTTEDTAATNDQSEPSAPSATEFVQAEVSAETTAEELTHPEASSQTEAPSEVSSATEIQPEESATSTSQSEKTAVTQVEAEKPALTKSLFEKPIVDEPKIEQLVAELIKGQKINRLNQKKLANLLKKLSDGINDSGELSVPFTLGARDSLVGSAANRMLSQGISRKQPKKVFVEAGINLVGVQQQIAAHAQQTEDQPLSIITSRRVKNAQQASAFCGLFPWC